jgi:integrase
MRKPVRRTFGVLADEFERVAIPARPRKKTTVESYRQTIANHLRPWFGESDLARLSRAPEEFEKYAVAKMRDGLSSKTVRNHLVLAGLMFKTARRWRWVTENPLDLVEKPAALPDVETETIDAATIAELTAAYRLLEADAERDEGFWYSAARRMTVVALSTGLRRGELLGLRWQDVDRSTDGSRSRSSSSGRRSRRRSHAPDDARSRSGRSPPKRSRNSGRLRGTGRTTRSYFHIRRSGRRSTHRSSRPMRERR